MEDINKEVKKVGNNFSKKVDVFCCYCDPKTVPDEIEDNLEELKQVKPAGEKKIAKADASSFSTDRMSDSLYKMLENAINVDNKETFYIRIPTP